MQKERTMTSDQIAAFIDRHAAAWNQRDPKVLCANHAAAGVVLSPMFHRVQGRARIQRTYSDLFAAFPDWELRYEEPFVSGARVAVFFSVTATHQGDFMGVAGTGRNCAFEGVSLFRLDADLLIEHERRVYDFTGLLVQLGVLRVRLAP
jgi:steroid delta-isomerase-like uncharacterized protein